MIVRSFKFEIIANNISNSSVNFSQISNSPPLCAKFDQNLNIL